ncbi:serine/threonine-protein kinase TBK1-like isoform X2 [Dreissena polymorpha]|nr:serine/threonine-protein kinase TBK1-like isoform X2 [Dreissena polymorpha]
MNRLGGSELPGSSISGGARTGTLHETQHFRWNTADVLGKGATATVFYGRNKDTGDVCAIKVFYERISRHIPSTRHREIDSMRRLQHDNIVKLIDLEKETDSNTEVLVMEYCAGGSLYSMLEQPQYAFGFPESEFRLFLKHIANGIRYLRQSGYIHRDIKPGNIMRYIGDDGSSLYKLTDFGAARELQEDETFTSIYGTEEYLYPRMYEQAVLRRPGQQDFDASVDLWSLGVTLYHVSTGMLPFQPFGGRSNSETMHKITSQKPEGALSGVQISPNGDIKWSNSLPDTCYLSKSLKALLEPMLAGLMELNMKKMWTFERFFATVEKLAFSVQLQMFSCCTGELMVLYVGPEDTHPYLQEKIAELTEIPASSQLILWHDSELKDVIDETSPMRSYPACIRKTRLYLMNSSCMGTGSPYMVVVPPFPEISKFDNLDLDCQSAKKACGIAHVLNYAVCQYLSQQKNLLKGETNFRRYLKRIVKHSELVVPEMRATLEQTRMRRESFSAAFTLLLNLFTILDTSLNVEELVTTVLGVKTQLNEPLRQLSECLKDRSFEEFFEKINSRLSEIEAYVDALSKRMREQERSRRFCTSGCSEEDRCLTKAESFKQKLQSVYSLMTRHKQYGDLHPHEKFIHYCEKQKQHSIGVLMASLVSQHCRHNLNTTFSDSQKEFGNLTKHLTRTKKVELNICSVKDSLQTLSSKLSEKEGKCRHIVERVISIVRSSLSNRKPSVGTLISLRNEEGYISRSGAGPSSSYEPEHSPRAKKQRTDILDRLTSELRSLQSDSEELKSLVEESSEVMKQFLTETSNLRIEGSLDSSLLPGDS